MTTRIYTHVLNRGGRGVCSRLNRLRKAVGKEESAISRPVGRYSTGDWFEGSVGKLWSSNELSACSPTTMARYPAGARVIPAGETGV